MNWSEILTILVPLAAFLGWIYNQMNRRFDSLEKDLDKMGTDITSIKDRLSRLEGRFDERGYWEAREFRKTGTEDKP